MPGTPRDLSLTALLALALVLAAPPPAAAAVFTVGPSGAHASLTQGLAAALTAGGDNEVRVEIGLYFEDFEVAGTGGGPVLSSGSLHLSGGWDSTFTTRDPDAALTVIEGDQRVAYLRPSGGELRLEGLTVQGGHLEDDAWGAGLRVNPTNDARVVLQNLRIVGNVIESTTNLGGAAISASLGGSSKLEILDCLMTGNQASYTGTATSLTRLWGGALSIAAGGTTALTIARTRIENNTASGSSGGQPTISIEAYTQALVTMIDTVVADNIVATSGPASSAFGIMAEDQASFVGRRNRFERNDWSGGTDYQVELWGLSGATGPLVLTDSLVAGDEAWVIGPNSGNIPGLETRFTNLTVTGASAGLLGGTSAYNNLVTTESGGGTVAAADDAGHNLVGVDPLFVDPAAGNYRIRPGSPAEDAGTNTPPGGLGPSDLDRGTRIVGGTVDIGAYEIGGGWIFGDGFESGDVCWWSAAAGAAACS